MALADYKPQYGVVKDPVVGNNDPFYTNTWDRTQQALQDALENKHTELGIHADPAIEGTNFGLMFTRPGTYTGDVNTDQVVTIADMDEVLYFKLWEEVSAVPVVAVASMTAGDAKRLTNEAFSTNYIKSLGTGEVTVTGAGNTDGVEYFYIAIGKKATPPTGNGISFTPSWLEHFAIKDDWIDVTTPAKVPNDLLDELIERAVFEHTDPDMNHTGAAYQNVSKIEVGSHLGTDLDHIITLQNPNADIQAVEVYGDVDEYPVLATRSMGADQSKRLSNTVLESGLIKNIATPGQFTVGPGDVVNGTRPLWVAVGFFINTIAISGNGISWAGLGNSIFSFSGNAVAWNGTRFMGGGNGTNTLAYSPDGINWTGLGKTIFSASGAAFAWNGTRWVAGGSGGITNNTLAYSDDNGETWVGLGNTIFDEVCNGIAWDGTKFVAAGKGITNTLAYSFDGINWVGLGKTIFSIRGYAVAWNGTRWVAGGEGTNTLAYSPDGINWTGIGSSIFSDFGAAVAWNGTRWVAGGGVGPAVAGTSPNTLAHSNDGIAWTGLGTSTFDNVCNSLAWNGNLFVAGGSGTTNTQAYSADGLSWTGLGNTIFSVVGGGVAASPAPTMTPAITPGAKGLEYHWRAIYK